MLFILILLSFALAAAIGAAAYGKPSSFSPPNSPQIRPHDQSADGIVAIIMAHRRDKKDRVERDASEANRAGESQKQALRRSDEARKRIN